jgi:hypothetical protein
MNPNHLYWGAAAIGCVAWLVWYFWPVLVRGKAADANAIEAALNTIGPYLPPELAAQVAIEVAKGRWAAKIKTPEAPKS